MGISSRQGLLAVTQTDPAFPAAPSKHATTLSSFHNLVLEALRFFVEFVFAEMPTPSII